MAKKKKSRFRGKVASNVQKQRSAGSSYGYLTLPGGVNIFSPKPGRVKLDILPYTVTINNHPDKDEEFEAALKGEIWYKRPFKIHRNVGEAKDSAICLTSFGKKCPICDYSAKRRAEGAEKDELDAYKPSMRNLYAVKVIGSKDFEEEKIYVWDMSHYLFQKLLNDELEEDPDNEIFPDLEEGKTLKIRFDEKSFGGNKYAEASRIDFYDRDSPYDEDILKEVPNLDDLLTELSYEQLTSRFFDEEEPEDENDTPKSKKNKKVKEPEVEEVEEEEEDVEEEDEMVECPACGGTGTNSKGRECPVCEGEGELTQEEYDEYIESQKDEEKPKKKKEKTKKETSNKCPHGHRFGKDCDEFEECDDCELWDECDDAS